jgi:hypothetical protein
MTARENDFSFLLTGAYLKVNYSFHTYAKVAQLVEALRYKLDNRGVDSHLCH